MEPKVLLMDEPFGALDALTRAHLQDELMKIVAKTKSTVVMVPTTSTSPCCSPTAS
jgi:nitrate/nitrite transport system ATP-binding protein